MSDFKAVLPGQFWLNTDGHARVMAVAEGYVMLRRRGCAPFVLPEKDLRATWGLDTNPRRPKVPFSET